MKQRLLKYDVMRVFAICMVLLGHISAYIVINYPDPSGAEFIVGNVFNGMRRGPAIPVFLMLTGALLLNEDKPFEPRRFYKKSLMPIVWLLVFWLSFYGAFYAFVLPGLLGKAVSAGDFVDYLLTFKGSDYPHLWYMFMTIGLYLSIPVLRLFVKRENRAYVLGFILAAMAVQFAPRMLDFLTRDCNPTLEKFIGKFHMQYAMGFTAYPLLGWYLANFPPAGSRRIGLYASALLLAVASTAAVQFLIADIPNIRSYLYHSFALHLLIAGAGVFVLISSLCGDRLTESSVIKTLSNAAFGVYAIHVVFLEFFSRVLMPYDAFGLLPDSPFARPLAYILILFAEVCLSSLASVLMLSKVRGIRSLLRY